MSTPRKNLVIGYGSPIRGDDALGPIVADRLQAASLPTNVTIIARHVLTADLLPDLLACERVIFIDAEIHGEPGEVYQRWLHPDHNHPAAMGHFLDPRELLTWAAVLYNHTPEALLVSTPAVSLDYAYCELSPMLAIAAQRVQTRVLELLASA